ncbi:MAG: TraR/DksA C4-type zinc finger protein [Desulfuromonadaceae bacterium]|nr:TraR/DksA C4-type zinc finger protein [Desulfuromonadaceae bacterium]
MTMNCHAAERYVPSEHEDYMNSRQRRYFHELLLKWKNDIQFHQRSAHSRLRQAPDRYSDLIDQYNAETGRLLSLVSANRSHMLLEQINAALGRLHAGDYGYCRETGEEIGIRRLLAFPMATLTVEAQEENERRQRVRIARHGAATPEGLTLYPPRLSFDE